MPNRILFAIALAGIALTIHIWIQRQRRFRQGCWGTQTGPSTGCSEILEEAEPRLFGQAPVVLGFIFYSALSSLFFATSILHSGSTIWLHRFCLVLSLCGFGHSIFLVLHQRFAGLGFCGLCMIAHGLNAIIAAIVTVQIVNYEGWNSSPNSSSPGSEAAWFGLITFVWILFLLGLIFFWNRVGLRGLNHPEEHENFVTMLGDSLPQVIDPGKLRDLRPCRFDLKLMPIVGKHAVPSAFPPIGNPEGIQFLHLFNPNCRSCRGWIREFQNFIAVNKSYVAGIIIPVSLDRTSMIPTAALIAAARSHKYTEFLESWADIQEADWAKESGLLRAAEQAGLDTINFKTSIQENLPLVLEHRKNWIRMGLSRLPLTLIEGRPVYPKNQTIDCLNFLLERVVKIKASTPQ